MCSVWVVHVSWSCRLRQDRQGAIGRVDSFSLGPGNTACISQTVLESAVSNLLRGEGDMSLAPCATILSLKRRYQVKRRVTMTSLKGCLLCTAQLLYCPPPSKTVGQPLMSDQSLVEVYTFDASHQALSCP